MATFDLIAESGTDLQNAYDAVEEMGGTLPTTKNWDNLPAAIDSIKAKTPIFAPDLSKVLDKAQLDNLQNIVGQGKAQEYLNLGDELLVNYGSYTMPFEVVGFEPTVAQVNSEDKTVYSVNLLAKYATETTTAWGESGGTPYSGSSLNNYYNETYIPLLDSDFVEALAVTKVATWNRSGSADYAYSKLYAPSMENLGVTDTAYNVPAQADTEGPVLGGYADSTNAKRIKYDIGNTTAARNYWTRSYYGSSSAFGRIASSGAPQSYGYANTFRAVAVCNLIGSNAEGPKYTKTLASLQEALNNNEAELAFPVGTEIPDFYNGYTNALIIAQYLDSTNNSAYGGAEGVILVRKYVQPASQTFGDTLDYTTSTIKDFLDTTYYDNCSEDLKAVAAEINIPLNGSTIKSKVFLMSDREVCSDCCPTVEGIMWDYWEQKTGLTSPNNNNNDGRIMKDRNGTARYAWLRSRLDSSLVCRVDTGGGVYGSAPLINLGVLPACFISKDN